MFTTSLKTKILLTTCLLVVAHRAHGATINVGAGGDFQAALDAAQCGDTIILQAGASYTVPTYYSFVLREKRGCSGTDADYITITTSDLGSLPPSGVRVNPAVHARSMAKLVGQGGAPVITTEPYAHHYKLIGLEITTNGASYAADLVSIGIAGSEGGYASRAETLSTGYISIDRCFIHPAEINASNLRAGVDHRTSGRGVALQGVELSVLNSDIRGFGGYYAGTTTVVDAYGIYIPKPPTNRIRIINNFVQAHTMNIFTGGSTSTTQYEGTVASGASATQAVFSNVNNLRINDYVAFKTGSGQWDYQVARVTGINGNTVTYAGLGPTALNRAPLSPGRVAWRGDNISNVEVLRNTVDKIEQAGGKKGYLELKSCVDCLIEGNVFQGEWASDVSLTPRNQGKDSPWSVTSNVIFRSNYIANASRCFALALVDTEATNEPGVNILVENNLCVASQTDTTATHTILQGGGSNVTIRHNTFFDERTDVFLFQYPQATPGQVIKDNILYAGRYGYLNCQVGSGTVSTCWPGLVKDHNAVVNVTGDSNSNVQNANPGDVIISNTSEIGFNNIGGRDFRLSAGSRFKGAASDQTDIGVNVDTLQAALEGAGAGSSTSAPPPAPPTNVRIIQ